MTTKEFTSYEVLGISEERANELISRVSAKLNVDEISPPDLLDLFSEGYEKEAILMGMILEKVMSYHNHIADVQSELLGE